jgi:hypothetical protein
MFQRMHLTYLYTLQDITLTGAKSLFAKKQWEVGAQVAQHYLTVVQKAEVPLSQVAANIKSLFEAYADPSPAGSTHPKYVFMRDAIKMTQVPKSPEISPEEALLSHAMAVWLFKGGERGLANAYYLKSNAHIEHSMKLVQWAKTCEPSEIDLFLLRSVLQYLCVGKVSSANHVYVLFEKCFGKMNAFVTSPAVHLAQMLIRACELKVQELFQILEEKYNMTLVRDPRLRKFFTKVGELHFGIKAPKGLLDSLFDQ